VAGKMIRKSLFINGAWAAPAGAGVISVTDPATEEVIGEVPEGTAADIDAAVKAAAAALPAWSARSPSERAAYCTAISEKLTEQADELAEVITRELGMPLKSSRAIQVGGPIRTFASMASVIKEIEFEEQVGTSLVIQEPIGVVGAITPWNYPLHQIAAKVAPAITAGCTVVLKPSEVTPLDAFVLADVFEAVGLPPGVVSVVSGYGPEAGEALAAHPLVDMISFTGSTRAGRRVSELAAATVKATALELGGKSPNVLLDDLDDEQLAQAVARGVTSCYANSGQTCSALTRMVVPRSRLAEVEKLAVETARTFATGDPFDPETRLGPLVSDVQRERVRGYIRTGEEEGAKLITGGVQTAADRGYFVEPTVFSNVEASMTIAQEEIFGPVLAIMPYDDEAQAVAIANDTQYGLAAGVWSADPQRARAVARQIRSGQIRINNGAPNPLAPFGGFRQSGHGREYGKFGLEEFLSPKSLQL
jgi:acyl-CoA reductase-like NAD-dependent aldehyde dehydrogenase